MEFSAVQTLNQSQHLINKGVSKNLEDFLYYPSKFFL